MSEAKTAAERKAAERQRHKKAGRVPLYTAPITPAIQALTDRQIK